MRSVVANSACWRVQGAKISDTAGDVAQKTKEKAQDLVCCSVLLRLKEHSDSSGVTGWEDQRHRRRRSREDQRESARSGKQHFCVSRFSC